MQGRPRPSAGGSDWTVGTRLAREPQNAHSVDVQSVAQTIQLILAPVVMVTASGILLTGLLGRYAAVNDRLRALAQERLALLRGEGDRWRAERLTEIDHQLPELLARHGHLHDAALAFYAGIAVFVVSMFAIGGASAARSAEAATVALGLFLAGTAVLLVGVVVAAREVRTSDRSVRYEVERIARIGADERENA